MTSWPIPWKLEAQVQKKGINAENDLRPKKNKKKSRNVPKKRGDVRKKHTQLENDVLADPLGVRGSNLVQKKGMNAENGLRPKKNKKKVGTSRKNAGTSRKTQERPEKNTLNVLPDPLGLRGSNLVQKKGINAENGVRPIKKNKKSRNVPKKTQGRPEKTHSTEKWRTGRSPGS